MRGAAPIARRVLLSLKGDRRTLGLVFGAPLLLIWLFSVVFDQVPVGGFDTGPAHAALLAVFVFMLTFLLTAVGFLRERQTNTIQRVFASPVSRWDVVLGYVAGYGVLATLQATVILFAGIAFLDLSFVNGIGLFFGLELLGALTALGIGIAVSMFAESEFQVLQFIPVLIAPQIILGGVFVPVEALPWYLEGPALTFPLTYLIDGMEYAILGAGEGLELVLAVGVLAGYASLSVAVSAVAMRSAKS